MNCGAARARSNMQRSAQLARACLHPRKVAISRESLTVIADHHMNVSPKLGDVDEDARCACMAMHVGECLLDDA
jgi:hypothetical protein